MGWANDAFARDLASIGVLPIGKSDGDTKCSALKYKGYMRQFGQTRVELLCEMRVKVKNGELDVPKDKVALCLKELDKWIAFRGEEIPEEIYEEYDGPKTMHEAVDDLYKYLNFLNEERRIDWYDYSYLHNLVSKINFINEKTRGSK